MQEGIDLKNNQRIFMSRNLIEVHPVNIPHALTKMHCSILGHQAYRTHHYRLSLFVGLLSEYYQQK